MKILLTNDDGIYAEGLWVLHKRLVVEHDITVVAPDRERSAVGHSITLSEPLRMDRIHVNGDFSGYAVSGTPVDCIKLGILEVLETRPDLVISGINSGANVGIDINYSGTVSAAREAALYGIPAMAISAQGNDIKNYDEIAHFVEVLAKNVFDKGLPYGTILNVNIPNVPLHETSGIKISRQGISLFSEQIEKRIDPRNRVYYWQGGEPDGVFEHSDVDGAVLKEKYISITPIRCDMTDYRMIDDLKRWDISIEPEK